MTDEYDEQIAYLTEHPEKIAIDWSNGKELFEFLGNGLSVHGGCLTMIKRRGGKYVCDVPELTERIKADDRIPESVTAITPASLPVLAEYQREYRRLKEKQ
jgi:hypothetical protein